MKPKFVTFTGIDDRVDLIEVDRLSQDFPIEWGVLFCANSSDARFPSIQTVHEFLDIVKHGQKSAHLCGKFVKQALDFDLDLPLDKFDRIQLNGYKIEKDKIKDFSEKYSVDVILQHRELEFFESKDHSLLFDLSGGRGKLPEQVPKLLEGSFVGYSGGIKPETVFEYLEKIKGTGDFWLDMEAGVRTDGWLDLRKVREVLGKVFLS